MSVFWEMNTKIDDKRLLLSLFLPFPKQFCSVLMCLLKKKRTVAGNFLLTSKMMKDISRSN